MKAKISLICRYVIALLFLYSAYDKIKGYNDFEAQLYKSTLINNEFIPYLQFIIPSLESVIFVLLVINQKWFLSLCFSFLVLFTYTAYLIALNDFSLYEGCSCGGILDSLSYRQHLWVNLLFIVINIIGIVFNPKKEVFESSIEDKLIP